MSSFKTAFPSKYLKASDLDGRRLIGTIAKVDFELIGAGTNQDRKLVAHFVETSLKPLVLNLVNSTKIAEIARTEEYDQWPGTRVVLYAAETTFQGKPMPCIRLAAPKSKAAVQPVTPPSEEAEDVPDFGTEAVIL